MHSDSHRHRVTAIVLTVLLFVIYNSNLRHGSGIDTIANTLLPVSLLHQGNFDLDEFRPMLSGNERNTLRSALFFGTLQVREGSLVGSYPIGAAIVALPFFFVADTFGLLDTLHDYRVTAKIASSFVSAMAAGMLFLCLVRFTALTPALLITIGFGLGTSMWPTVSQDMWQHGPGMLCLLIALYCILQLRDRASLGPAVLAGVALSLAVICRPTNVVPVALLALFMLIEHRRRPVLLLACYAPAAIFAIWLVLYNLNTYNNVTGGYDAIFESSWHYKKYGEVSNRFNSNLAMGLTGILFSANKGLLIFSPYLVFAFIAAAWSLLRRRNLVTIVLLLWVAAGFLMLSASSFWHGGTAFGPRYTSELLIPLSLLLGIGWSALFSRGWMQGIFVLLLAVSIGIQTIGTFRSPCGWDRTPKHADRHPERYWDWQDTQIQRCLKNDLLEGEELFEILYPRSPEKDF